MMGDDECFKPNVTLCRLALVAISTQLWELPLIKKRIRQFFSKDEEFINNPSKWHKITNKVLKLIPQFPIQPPLSLLKNLEDIVGFTGEKIYKWFLYVKKHLGLDFSYAEQIYWTVLGTIDEDKIFKLYWQKDTSLYVATEDSDDVPIFRLACIFTQEDFIDKHKKRMIEEFKRLKIPANEHNVQFEVSEMDDNDPEIIIGILSTQLEHFIGNIFENDRFAETGVPVEYCVQLGISCFNGEFLPSIAMYQCCFAAGFNQAAKYFLKQLDNDEKVLHFEDNIGSLVYKFYKVKSYTDYRAEKYGQICLDYVSDDSVKVKLAECEDTLKVLQNYKVFISDILLNLYPAEEFFIPLFKNISKNIVQSDDFEAFLTAVTGHIVYDYYMNYPMKRNIYEALLPIVWKKTSKEYKKKLCTELELLKEYFDIGAFSSIKVLLNWKYFSPDDVTLCMVNLIRSKVRPWIDEEDFNTLKQFIEEVFNPDEYYKEFIWLLQKFFIRKMIQNGKFDLLDPFLNSISVYNTEGNLKNEIHVKNNVEKLIQENKFDLIDSFLEWRLDSKEDKKYFKKEFQSSEFPLRHICSLWAYQEEYSKDTAEEKSAVFLKWLFEEDYDSQIIQFKESLINNDEWIERLLFICSEGYSEFKFIENFGAFCGKSLEEMKQKIKQNLNYCMSKQTVRAFDEMQSLLKWLYPEDEEKENVVKNFISSSDILSLCSHALDSWSFISEANLLIFYNKWVRKSNNISQLKNDLINMIKNIELPDGYEQKVSSLYEKLEKSEISAEDVFFVNNLEVAPVLIDF